MIDFKLRQIQQDIFERNIILELERWLSSFSLRGLVVKQYIRAVGLIDFDQHDVSVDGARERSPRAARDFWRPEHGPFFPQRRRLSDASLPAVDARDHRH